jgi:hypothetical protein
VGNGRGNPRFRQPLGIGRVRRSVRSRPGASPSPHTLAPSLHHLVSFGGFRGTTSQSDFQHGTAGRSGSASRPTPARVFATLAAPAGPPRFRRQLFVREMALDPGGATPSRVTTAHMLPSLHSTSSASATFPISWLNPTPHTIPVYASDPALPRRPQDSVLMCPLRLSSGRTFTYKFPPAWPGAHYGGV